MLRHPDHPRGVVRPLDARSGDHLVDARADHGRTNGAGPAGPAMVVGWRVEPAAHDRYWGEPLPAGTELGQRLARVAAYQRGATNGFDGGLTFRLSLPEAFGVEPLLRLADGPAGPAEGFGRAVLVPLSAPRTTMPVPGAPLGLLALTLLTEIATTDTQNRVLTEVTGAVHELAPGSPTRLDARLRAAEETLRAAQSALVARGTIPEEVAFGTAGANLSVLRHQTVAHIAGWERAVEDLDPSGTPGAVVRETLGAVGRLGWAEFPGAVHAAYQALVLDARRLLLSAAEQQLRTPDRPLTALRPIIEADLTARAADVARLHRILTRLSVTPLSVRRRSRGVLPHLVAEQALENSRTQALFTRMAGGLTPTVRSGGASYDLEVQARPTGELHVLRPAA